MENKLYRVLVIRKRDHGAKKHTVTNYAVMATSKEVAIALAGDNHHYSTVEAILATELDEPVALSSYMYLSQSEVAVYRDKYK